METQLSALNTTVLNPVQLLKALFPMVDTALPMVSEVSPLQLLKALPPMARTELGMTKVSVKPNPENAKLGMVFTLSPMVSVAGPVQPEKTLEE